MNYYDTNGVLREAKGSQDRFFQFIYAHALTRALLKPLVKPGFSRFAGKIMDSGFSRVFIKSFIRKNGIDMKDFEERKFRSFNDFFTRKVKPEARPVPAAENLLFSPCDAYLTAVPVEEGLRFTIKHTEYTLPEFLKDDALAKSFEGGTVLLFRLAVQHYHRYHFTDNGKIVREYRIPGFLHTVQPSANEAVSVYKQNARAVTIMETEHFGTVVQTEVGALLVGRIKNRPVREFVRAEEKGMFEFGGSTVVMILKKDAVRLRPGILKASEEKIEHEVRFGTVLGET